MKKVYTVKAKAIIHTVRTYKKWAASIEEARELVNKEPKSFIEEDKVSSELNDMFLPCWILDEDQLNKDKTEGK